MFPDIKGGVDIGLVSVVGDVDDVGGNANVLELV
jgi:hypothetical protein